MKFLLDENVPISIKLDLNNLGYEVLSLHDFNKLGFKNGEVAELALKEDAIIITLDSDFFGYVFSYLSMVHLSKKDTGIAINEMHRVLMKEGLCYLNFLSIDDANFDKNKETNPGEIISKHGNEENIHSYFEDDEPDEYFNNFQIIYKEKRLILRCKYYNTGRTCIIDYIIKK